MIYGLREGGGNGDEKIKWEITMEKKDKLAKN